SDKLLDLVGLGGKSAADQGKDTRDYLAAAFPELNAWERAGADASSAGMVDAGFENQKELTKMQLDNQKEIEVKMSTVESIARPRRNGERRRAPTASISKESPAITGVVEMVIRRPI